jgi:8-oxo-dGTP pyrophosphatase MutT (NUDIX family)
MTLLRELEEEVNITISKSKMIGYFEVVSNKPTIYQLRYAALIDEINPSQIDPALNVINERKLINPNEFFNYIKYEDCGPMLNEAVAWFKNPN